MKTLSQIPSAWVYVAQAFITAAEVLRLGFRDAFYTLKEPTWKKNGTAYFTVTPAKATSQKKTLMNQRAGTPALTAVTATQAMTAAMPK